MGDENRSELVEMVGCVDCALWLANGDLSGMPDGVDLDGYRARVAERLDGLVGVHVGGLAAHFSSRGCDVCGSGLGGERFEVRAWLNA